MQDIALFGSVEGITHPRGITGFIGRADGGEPTGARVAIYDTTTGQRIGNTLVSLPGVSLPGDATARGFAFSAPLKREVTAADLREGRIAVRARLPRGPEWPLELGPALRLPALPAPGPALRGLEAGFINYCQLQGYTLRLGGQLAPGDLALEAPCLLVASSLGPNVAIGAYTGVYGHLSGALAHAGIGRFCSIADRFMIAPDEVPTHFLSTSMMQFSSAPGRNAALAVGSGGGAPRAPLVAFDQPGATVIGHDVWVGAGVFIRRGITIGHGAILAAGAVVVADVAPYMVVGGVPARAIRQRFDDAMVARLLALRWWDYNVLAQAALRFDVIADAVGLLEDSLAAGLLAPLPVRPTTLGALHTAWLTSGGPA